MTIDIVTLFPECFTPLFTSIPGRIQQSGKARVEVHDLRQWGQGKHLQVDDTPYGGGPGMVMSCGPWFAALGWLRQRSPGARICYLTPQGKPLDQAHVLQLSKESGLILMCGHYEGIDERVIEHWVDEEICIGDFVVSGGELPAMMLTDAVLRVLPGALSEGSAEQDSFYNGLLDCPHYTRPSVYEGRPVPEVLLSGHHQRVECWRREQSLQRTRLRRPDLYARWLSHEEAEQRAGSKGLSPVEGASHGQEIPRARAGIQEEGSARRDQPEG